MLHRADVELEDFESGTEMGWMYINWKAIPGIQCIVKERLSLALMRQRGVSLVF